MFERKSEDEETNSSTWFRAEAASHEIRDSSKPVGAYLSPTKRAGERPRSREIGIQKGGDNKERRTRWREGGRRRRSSRIEEAQRRGETKKTKEWKKKLKKRESRGIKGRLRRRLEQKGRSSLKDLREASIEEGEITKRVSRLVLSRISSFKRRNRFRSPLTQPIVLMRNVN